MPDHIQGRTESMAPGDKKKRSPLSAIVIIALFAAIIGVLVLN